MRKRFFALMPLFVMIVILMSMTTAFAASLGDVDGNGRITAADARIALRSAAKLEQLSPGQEAVADADGDGKITATDARLILRVAARLDVFASASPGTPLSPSDVHDLAAAYTVEITAENDSYISTGSGFFISDDGQVVTNYHVIEGMYAITVTDYYGNTYPVTQILAYAADLDIAVLKIEAPTPSAVLNRSKPKTGAVVYTLGSSDGMTDTFTNGIISNNARVDETYNPYMTYYQITAPITHGNSGGPLINEAGEVIGINTWSNTAAQNMNFAIPVHYLDQLDYGYPVTPEEFGGYYRPVAEDLAVDMTELYLCPGGTARITVELSDALTDRGAGLTAMYDTDVLQTVWSDWYVSAATGQDVIFLFVSGLQESAYETLVIAEADNPQVCVEIPVHVTSDGWEDYGDDPGFPDFGAFVGAAPYACMLSDTADTVSYTYSIYDVIAAGADDYTLFNDFPALLNRYGYDLYQIGTDQDGDYEMTYVNANGNFYSYYLIYDKYDPDTITDILIMYTC